jgi:hypothetical protein
VFRDPCSVAGAGGREVEEVEEVEEVKEVEVRKAEPDWVDF